MSEFTAKIQAILDTKNIPSQIANIEKSQIRLSNFTLDTKRLPSQIQASLDGHNFMIKLDGIKMANLNSQVKTAANRVGKTFSSQLVDRINAQLSNGGIEASIARVTAQYEKLGTSGHAKLKTIGTDLEALNTLHSNLAKNQSNPKALVKTYDTYIDTLTRVKNNLVTVSSQSKVTVSSLQAGKLDNKMAEWLNKNTRATKDYGEAIEKLRSQLDTLSSNGKLSQIDYDNIKFEFEDIVQQATAAGKAGETFGSRMSRTFGNMFRYFGAAEVLHKVEDVLKSMAENVVAVDTAMTGLYRVTDLTDEQYQKMYSNMVKSAKQYGTELVDIINSTADWAKLGFSVTEAQELANITSMYQHVTDLDTETAVNNLVTAYKGFEDQLLELTGGDVAAAVEYVADIFDKLGNEFAVDASDVGEALTRSASALQVAGNSIQETAAMATGITEVTQNAAKAGNALRTLSMRLRGTTAAELEAIGEDADGLIEVTSSLQGAIKDLTGVDLVNTLTGDLRSTYDVMRDLAGVWDTLGTNTQSRVLEIIAGKNRASDVAALLSNWEQVEKAMLASTDAWGTAAAEQEKYVESIQGHLNQLKTSWQALSNTIIKSDFLKGLVDAGSAVLNTFDFIIGKIGTLPTLVGTVFAGLSIGKNVGERINQFQYRIILRIEYAHGTFTNSNVNEIAC